jgi:hypothetical protein
MRHAAKTVSVLALLCAAAPLQGQIAVATHAAFFAEHYKFEDGFVFGFLSEFTVPVGINASLGRRTNLTISTGWTDVELKSQNPTVVRDQTMSGVIDTELRVTVEVIPSRLSVIANGVIPTGIKTVRQDELSVLGAISSDIIGLTTNELGNGGSVGGGFVGAVPVGDFAVGFGATYKAAFKYQAVFGDPSLRPGNEARFRAGLEGPLGKRTYFRVAGIYAVRGADQLGSEVQNGVGDRIVGYLSLNQAVGPSSLVVYSFNVYRTNPQLSATALGAQSLPKGNLFAAGARWEFRMGRRGTVAPRAEFRSSVQAPVDDPKGSVKFAGLSLRGGADLRYQANRKFAVVLQADGVTGQTRLQGIEYWLRGFRLGIHGELTP